MSFKLIFYFPSTFSLSFSYLFSFTAIFWVPNKDITYTTEKKGYSNKKFVISKETAASFAAEPDPSFWLIKKDVNSTKNIICSCLWNRHWSMECQTVTATLLDYHSDQLIKERKNYIDDSRLQITTLYKGFWVRKYLILDCNL